MLATAAEWHCGPSCWEQGLDKLMHLPFSYLRASVTQLLPSPLKTCPLTWSPWQSEKNFPRLAKGTVGTRKPGEGSFSRRPYDAAHSADVSVTCVWTPFHKLPHACWRNMQSSQAEGQFFKRVAEPHSTLGTRQFELGIVGVAKLSTLPWKCFPLWNCLLSKMSLDSAGNNNQAPTWVHVK